VVGILTGFAVLGLFQIDPALLAPSTYPPLSQIFSSIGLTFFAFLGFGIMTFTAGDLGNPKRDLPRAMFAALGITTAIYIALSLSVFGTLTVEEVVAAGPTAIAKAAEPILGQLGYVIIVITATMATAGCVNSGLYPANGFSRDLVAKGQFPPLIARPILNGTVGLLITAGLALFLSAFFDLSAVANMGSAAALLVFFMVSIAHLRVVQETGAKRWLIILSAVVTGGAFLFFTATTVASDPITFIALIIFIVLSIVVDFLWKRMSAAKRQATAGL
jgi:amino acid transporter